MFAIIADGGRQYKVEKGQILDIDYRDPSLENIVFDRVLAVSTDDGLKLGSPTVDGASVKASVMGEQKGEKLYIQKFRRRKNYEVRTGHRQKYLRVKIDEIAV